MTFFKRIVSRIKTRHLRIVFSNQGKLGTRVIKLPKLIEKLPFSRLNPYRTFIPRSWQKFLLLYGDRIGLSGATPIGNSSTGNSILKLKFRSALGFKGTEIELPKDGAIYEHVRKSGSWETNSSYFLSKTLRQLEGKSLNTKIAFVDLGANSGLVTLQTMRYAQTQNVVLMVEPLPNHVQAIRRNLQTLQTFSPLFHIFEFALGRESGYVDIFTEENNHGNSSLLLDAMENSQHFQKKIAVKKSEDFFSQYFDALDYIVIKSDLQGMDAYVLSKIPIDKFESIQSAVVEVWALPEINPVDVDKFIDAISFSHSLGWSENSLGKLSPKIVREFWLSKSGLAKDLFIKKIS